MCSPALTLTAPPDPQPCHSVHEPQEKGITSTLCQAVVVCGFLQRPGRCVRSHDSLWVGAGQTARVAVGGGKALLPLPAAACWAHRSGAPENSTAGLVIKDLQLRSFHTVQSASH